MTNVRIEVFGDGLLPAVTDIDGSITPVCRAWTQAQELHGAHYTPVFSAMIWVDPFSYGTYYGDVGRDDCSDLLDLCEAAREVRLHSVAP